ncbi:MAG: hypothetical protein R2711_09035 [Acidimicrobiales bacterium]
MAPDGSFTYIPEAGFHGTDSLYGITDAADQTAPATVTITVDPPAALPPRPTTAPPRRSRRPSPS